MVASQRRLVDAVKAAATHPRERAIQSIVNSVGNAQVVLIGEMTHGTKEFYEFRCEITKTLVEKCGFSFVAVEGDWPDVYRINRFVQTDKTSDSKPEQSLRDFTRFPQWMWRNETIRDFVGWLRKHNDSQKLTGGRSVGMYGLDLYSMFRSSEEVVKYLSKVDPAAAELATERYGHLSRYRNKEERYGYDVGLKLAPSVEQEVLTVLLDLLKKGPEYIKSTGGFLDGDEYFYTTQNARVVTDAEEYYRKSMFHDESTWNIRDTHMANTLEHLIAYHEDKSVNKEKPVKAVVWAHNSHVGDSRATGYSETGEFNIGQLIRDRFGLTHTFNIGFTTFNGTVTAANYWGGPAEKMVLNDAESDTYESVLHEAKLGEYALIFRNAESSIPNIELAKLMDTSRYERMIGVQYVKKTERRSHYIRCHLPKQFDCVVHIDRTSALKPLED